MQTIPLFVIGGFLGAGKTTLLNRLLAGATEKRLAVLVNDFGSVNIDAMLISKTAGNIISLTNGCVCCSIGDDLSAALIQIMETSPQYDAIVIESSGVSDPGRIAQIAAADPELEIGCVIVLIDSAAIPAQLKNHRLHDTITRQIKSADLLVLNKTDLTPPELLQFIRNEMKTLAPGVSLIETVGADVPLDDFFSGIRSTSTDHCAHAEHSHNDLQCDSTDALCEDGFHFDHGSEFVSFLLRPNAAWSIEELRARLRKIPQSVIRLKGIVCTTEGHWVEVQYAGRRGSLRPTYNVPADGQVLVAIGLRGELQAAEFSDIFCMAERHIRTEIGFQ